MLRSFPHGVMVLWMAPTCSTSLPAPPHSARHGGEFAVYRASWPRLAAPVVSPQSGRGGTVVAACYALCRNVVLHEEPAMFQYNDGGDCPDHGPYGDDDCPKC